MALRLTSASWQDTVIVDGVGEGLRIEELVATRVDEQGTGRETQHESDAAVGRAVPYGTAASHGPSPREMGKPAAAHPG